MLSKCLIESLALYLNVKVVMETGWSGISIPPNQTAVRDGNAVKTKRHFGFLIFSFEKRKKWKRDPCKLICFQILGWDMKLLMSKFNFKLVHAMHNLCKIYRVVYDILYIWREKNSVYHTVTIDMQTNHCVFGNCSNFQLSNFSKFIS